MKCLTCKILEPFKSKGFSTFRDFDNVESLLKELSVTNQLKFDKVATYLCTACGAKWELSDPDNAYRGWLEYVSPQKQKIIELRAKLKI